MWRVISGVSAMLLLAGCAHAPAVYQKVEKQPLAIQKKQSVNLKIDAPPPATPNEIVKHRWYDRFKKHPKWFH